MVLIPHNFKRYLLTILTSKFLIIDHAFTITPVRLSNFFIVITFGTTMPDPTMNME